MHSEFQRLLAQLLDAHAMGQTLSEHDMAEFLRGLDDHCIKHQLPLELQVFRTAHPLDKGENGDQSPASLWSDILSRNQDPLALHRFQVLAGNPSYNSECGLDHGLWILRFLAEAFRRWKGKVPHIAGITKHGDPCGAAVSWDSPSAALLGALLGDPLAVMGGELTCNFEITTELADVILNVPDDLPVGRKLWGLDVISASGVTPEALEKLGGRKKNPRKVMTNPALANPELPTQLWVNRPVIGGNLRQKTPSFVLGPDQATWIGNPLMDDQYIDLLLAWACCWFGRSNSIAIANNGKLIARGFGQQDRVGAVRLALYYARRSRHELIGSMVASDAFYFKAEAERNPDAEHMLRYIIVNGGYGRDKACDFLALDRLRAAIDRADTRESPQLLIDAGCKGGVVTSDGQHIAEVQECFRRNGVTMGYVDPNHRGFRWH